MVITHLSNINPPLPQGAIVGCGGAVVTRIGEKRSLTLGALSQKYSTEHP
ncbi:hypothetical protein [Nostoc sp. ATCC 53789]|nr:hypothetical protein [Nostoc sp. ATCC 53789]QHG14809.1 hypothetical protein GJB62_01625 [Nostoc sp. ATCC 53789]